LISAPRLTSTPGGALPAPAVTMPEVPVAPVVAPLPTTPLTNPLLLPPMPPAPRDPGLRTVARESSQAHAPIAHVAPASSRLPWIITGVSVLIAVVSVCFVLLLAQRREQADPQPSPDPEVGAVEEVRCTFDSTPRGARVEESGVILGVTPF